jgi:hypothetical protein
MGDLPLGQVVSFLEMRITLLYLEGFALVSRAHLVQRHKIRVGSLPVLGDLHFGPPRGNGSADDAVVID